VVGGAGCKKPPPPDGTKVIVGVQSEPMGGIVSALHIVIRVAGDVVDDETITPPHGSRVGFPQPWETSLSGDGKGAAKVEVSAEAIGAPGQPPLITRLASTQFVPGKVSLLRVQLESRCVVYPPPPPGSKIPGPLSGPTCTAPATCIHGVCAPGYVPPGGLEPYASNWPSNALPEVPEPPSCRRGPVSRTTYRSRRGRPCKPKQGRRAGTTSGLRPG
jgi:hypothetical protein